MLPALLIALAAIAGAAFAQNHTNFQTCCEIDPGSEPADTLSSWCRAQTHTCPLLCEHGQTANNTCEVVSRNPFLANFVSDANATLTL
jgi:hypothetical protein